jgi:subtilisin family serine protease
MHRTFKLLLTVALAAAITGAPARPAAADAGASETAALEAAGVRDIIVRRDPGLSADRRRAVRAAVDGRLVETTRLPDTEVIRVGAGELTEALAELAARPDVRFAEPDAPVAAFADDPYWSTLWGLQNTGRVFTGESAVADADIDAPEAWSASTGAGATVAVVDTGVEQGHPDLAGRLDAGWDFVEDDAQPQDVHGHGTHVAGTIAAARANGTGVAGVAPDARVVALRALGGANGTGSSSDLADAFDYAGDLGVPVVNASLGSASESLAVATAILAHPQTLYVVAAGNDRRDVDRAPQYPCATQAANVLCVGASDWRDAIATWTATSGSNYGATTVDLFAPGSLIVSTYLTTSPTCAGYCAMNGSSMATPHVAGAAALVAAYAPHLRGAALKQVLLESVDVKPQLAGMAVTGGRLNAAAALARAGATVAAPVPEPTATPAATASAAPAATPAPASPAVALAKLALSARTLKRSVTVVARVGRPGTLTLAVRRSGSSTVLGRATYAVKAGLNRITLTRRLGGRTLRAGRYSLTLSVQAAGETPSRRTVALRVA